MSEIRSKSYNKSSVSRNSLKNIRKSYIEDMEKKSLSIMLRYKKMSMCWKYKTHKTLIKAFSDSLRSTRIGTSTTRKVIICINDIRS